MARPVATRVLQNLNKYHPVVGDLGRKHPEFSRTINLVRLAVNGLAKYYGLFILDQHGKLINAARVEDDYSRNVTSIGRELRTWAKNPNLTLKGKMGLDQLYLILERCLRDALELYTESERELIREGVKIYLSASDGYGEYERAEAALWKFQNEFHLHQIDPRRGSDRAIIYGQPGFSGLPAGFGNVEFSTPRWQVPDDDSIRILTKDEQTQLKKFISRPEVQKLLPDDLRNSNIILPSSDEEEDDDDVIILGPSRAAPVSGSKSAFSHRKGILKNPLYGAKTQDRPKKTVHFGHKRSPPVRDVETRRAPLKSPPVVPSDSPRIIPPVRSPVIPLSPPPVIPSSPPPVIPSSPPTIIISPHSPSVPVSPRLFSTICDIPPSPVKAATKEASNPRENTPGFVAFVEKTTIPQTPTSIIFTNSSSSDSWPTVATPRNTAPSPFEDDASDSGTSSSSSETSRTTASSRTSGSDKSERRFLTRTEEVVRDEVAQSIRAYLGRRHSDYGVALAVDPAGDPAEDEGEELPLLDDDGQVVEERPYDEEAYTFHFKMSLWSRDRAARDAAGTMLPHWAGVAKAKRKERIQGLARLRTILSYAEREGKVPLSPSSIRASTGLRRGIFTPIGGPDLPTPPASPPPRRRSRLGDAARSGPGPYREATLANLAQLRPRVDLTLAAFRFNEDALRLFGGLVGERPRPSDLGRMDKVLRELEVYIAVCAHRRDLIVGHLKRTREFPLTVPAQLGDLRAALQDAEEAVLSSSRQCFEYVAARSRFVMSYPARKRRRREFAGRFGPRDRERLEYLSGVEAEAERLWAELGAAEEWHGWCVGAAAEWNTGKRPWRVEEDMLYVGEDAQADVRRYQREINQKRVNLGLVTVRRPQDEVYERQQQHIRGLDALWRLMH